MELSPRESSKEMSPLQGLGVPPMTFPKKNLPKRNLVRDISPSESPDSDVEVVGPLIITTDPKAKEGNTAANPKNPSPLVAVIYTERLGMEKKLPKGHWADSDSNESLLRPVFRSA